MLALSRAGDEELYLPMTGGLYLLAGRDCLNRTGHNYVDVWKDGSPGFFVLEYGSEAIYLLACPELHS